VLRQAFEAQPGGAGVTQGVGGDPQRGGPGITAAVQQGFEAGRQVLADFRRVLL
jgi:hypothetical protein